MRNNTRYYDFIVYMPSKHRMSNGKYHVKCCYHASDYGKAYRNFQKTLSLKLHTFCLDLYAYVFAKGVSAHIIETRLAKGDFTTSDKWGEIIETSYCKGVLNSK